ncbi:hypothetical protein HaLaN_13709 [Haematococcus lacustris]|uniref:Uncharacterized protein n=1 Tax=Haematococcus lacustris TaxID=44745 RepID=A0A699Z6F6_HAELA|nr:hypothetical protein HaLaN_13709 [Haematococcus lacustris]
MEQFFKVVMLEEKTAEVSMKRHQRPEQLAQQAH